MTDSEKEGEPMHWLTCTSLSFAFIGFIIGCTVLLPGQTGRQLETSQELWETTGIFTPIVAAIFFGFIPITSLILCAIAGVDVTR